MNNEQSYVICQFQTELNDFLSPQYRNLTFKYNFKGRVSVKDLIESVGVPHTEIDLILANSREVDFSYHVQHQDEITVYPLSHITDISRQSRIRPEQLSTFKFVVDSHLGKLVKYLRMLGFDTLYRTDYSDSELALISQKENRILLTRDLGLLKHRIINYGHFVKQTQPRKQLLEIIQWLNIDHPFHPFTRCIRCNGLLASISKHDIEEQLLPKTKEYYTEFKQCQACKHIYWKGSHYQRMQKLITNLTDNLIVPDLTT